MAPKPRCNGRRRYYRASKHAGSSALCKVRYFPTRPCGSCPPPPKTDEPPGCRGWIPSNFLMETISGRSSLQHASDRLFSEPPKKFINEGKHLRSGRSNSNRAKSARAFFRGSFAYRSSLFPGASILDAYSLPARWPQLLATHPPHLLVRNPRAVRRAVDNTAHLGRQASVAFRMAVHRLRHTHAELGRVQAGRVLLPAHGEPSFESFSLQASRGGSAPDIPLIFRSKPSANS